MVATIRATCVSSTKQSTPRWTQTYANRHVFRFRSKPQSGSRQSPHVRGRQQTPTLLVASATEDYVEKALSNPEWFWNGADEFTDLDDRKDLPPLPLPEISEPKRVVLVRHGQSTWNAEGRMQGASDFGVLTAKGEEQAIDARNLLEDDNFEALFHSPLKRAAQTAELVWGDRFAPKYDLASLREIDFYSFQGLMKDEMRAKYAEEFKIYKANPEQFQIDGHYPVRELWHRASLAWQRILTDKYAQTTLVVAHNAINRALISTAIGLPPSAFNTFQQANAAISVVDFTPSPNGGPPHATLDRMNNSAEPLFTTNSKGTKDDEGMEKDAVDDKRVILVRCAATDSTEDGLITGRNDEKINMLGRVQARKTAEMLLDVKIGSLVCADSSRSLATANEIADLRELNSEERPDVVVKPELMNLDVGDWEGMPAIEVRGSALPENAERLEVMWQRAGQAWKDILEEVEEKGTVVVVGHAAMHGAMLCQCLDLPMEAFSNFHLDTGSVTVIEFPEGALHGQGVVRCTNHTSHMGRWAVPATVNLNAAGCGVEGCFIY
mmetsp:Transcript_38505/g.46507  ORF Transcript_38505/g.46507 Transcript_38505/m.46507 type:complete len:551 (-) Transcript_38505:408-2060(-)|eukprot:CAMPEP_0197854638 /NCGR_PEP_ID=MMETSP1438-20131217/25039_1 /TAXON_ID=1461541 /ORGANISM="Pterosperma sp., Strain CCMP1384" /LENGTH=550 /DNA_ID=CAMNT_0043469447 /DNA_START=85 /DNA_END=1737 /DNA_ORIENTATION=+